MSLAFDSPSNCCRYQPIHPIRQTVSTACMSPHRNAHGLPADSAVVNSQRDLAWDVLRELLSTNRARRSSTSEYRAWGQRIGTADGTVDHTRQQLAGQSRLQDQRVDR